MGSVKRNEAKHMGGSMTNKTIVGVEENNEGISTANTANATRN